MRAAQTIWQSAKEAATSTGLGFGLSWLSHCWIIAPLLVFYHGEGANVSGAEAGFLVTMYYTVLSFIRVFLVRRWHEWRLRKTAEAKQANPETD